MDCGTKPSPWQKASAIDRPIAPQTIDAARFPVHKGLIVKAQIYQILHVVSMVLLTAFTIRAIANPVPETKKKTMIVTGILSLLMLVGGFGLLAVLKYGFYPWILVKIVCWLVLSAMAGMAFRQPSKASLWNTVTITAVILAVVAVYLQFGSPSVE